MDKEKVIEYILYTPQNVNRTVLKGLVGEGVSDEDFEVLIKYCQTTPTNSNRAVLYSLLNSMDNMTKPIVGVGIVGSAII